MLNFAPPVKFLDKTFIFLHASSTMASSNGHSSGDSATSPEPDLIKITDIQVRIEV